MLKKERQAYILHQVNVHNKVLSSLLSNEIRVSEDTIRRDLHELAEEGTILKVHGGAISKTFHYPFDGDNKVYAVKAKQQIAEKAIGLFKNNMTILIENTKQLSLVLSRISQLPNIVDVKRKA